MAKSTVHAALASLQFKFQAKIREVGKLKKQISEGNNANVEIQRLHLRNGNLVIELLKSDKALRLTEVRATSAEQAYTRLTGHVRDIEGRQKDLKAEVSSWKGFVVIGTILGVAVGALSALAYVAQTTPL